MFTSRRSLVTLAALTILMLVAAACSSTVTGVSTGERFAYASARAKWTARHAASYQWVVQRGFCECLPEWTRPLLVAVEPGSVIVVDAETRQPIPSLANAEPPTVDHVFDLIENAIEADAYRLRVEYDAVYGYPRLVEVDWDERMVDDEVRIEGREMVVR